MLAPSPASSVVTAATMPGRSAQERVRMKLADISGSVTGGAEVFTAKRRVVKAFPTLA